MRYFGMPCSVRHEGDKLVIRVRSKELAEHGYPEGKMTVVLPYETQPQPVKDELIKNHGFF